MNNSKDIGMGKLPAIFLFLLAIISIAIATPVSAAAGQGGGLASIISSSGDSTMNSGSALGNQPSAAVKGGVLRIISSASPQVLGYIPDMDASDSAAVFPVVERLMDASRNRSNSNGLEPVLCSSVDDDIANNRIVFHLRSGIQFSDGSPLDADTVIWNFQQLIDAGALKYSQYLRQIQKTDDLTVEIDYSEYNNQLIQNWGWTAIMSRSAWEAASGGNQEQGRDWARTHVVGTGPFVLQEFAPNEHMTLVKNANYWRSGMPYLDGIEVTYVTDAAVAKKMMLAGEADEWDGAPVSDQQEMLGKGFSRVSSWPGMPWSIWPNTASGDSTFNDVRVRQAVEYALDKPALAQTLGKGFYTTMTMVSPSGEWGYDANYPARNYNPAKAKQLLAEAGYSGGIQTRLLISDDSGAREAGKTIKKYLDDVGIRVDLDVADPVRFYRTVWGENPSPGLAWMWTGEDVNYLVTYLRWFSSVALNNMAYLGHSADQQSLDSAAIYAYGIPAQKTAVNKAIRYLADQCNVIPVYEAPSALIVRSGVHTTRFSDGFIRWRSEECWIEGQ